MSSYSRDVDGYLGRSTGPAQFSRASSTFSAYSDNDLWKHPSPSPARSLRSQSQAPRYNNNSRRFQNPGLNGQRRQLDGIHVQQDNVVIRAGFSLLPPCISRTTFKTRYEPFPAHADPQTDSARLSAQIKDFLKRSDHIEEQWVQMHPGRKSHSRENRDKISTSIAIRGYQMSHSASWATLDGTDSIQNSDAVSLMDVPNVFDEAEESDASISRDIHRSFIASSVVSHYQPFSIRFEIGWL